MTTLFDFETRLPCRILTKEEIAAQYGERATRPIPAGYKKPSVNHRLAISGAKPYAVFALIDGKRKHVSSHHSIDAADRRAAQLNEGMTDPMYISGERMGKKGFVRHEITSNQDSSEDSNT